jgi:hypothetical protein
MRYCHSNWSFVVTCGTREIGAQVSRDLRAPLITLDPYQGQRVVTITLPLHGDALATN